MKIEYALVGSNNNPMYLDFWPVISKVWKTKFNITPVLGYIGNENIEISEEYGKVFRFDPIEGYDTGLLSQLVRFYLPKKLDGNCIISDIDMIPLSKKYFVDEISNFNDDCFVIMSSHHPQTYNTNQYPMCYVVGNDKIYKELFNLNDTWESFIKKIPLNGWFTDQIHLYKIINENKNFKYEFPNRNGGFFSNRIDRINWVYDSNKVKNGEYVDCHSLRPYSLYKNEIDILLNLI